MKILKIIYLTLTLVGLATVAYNYIVVQPELPDFDKIDFGYLASHPEAEAAMSNARHTSDLLGILGTCLAGIGAILASIGFFKTQQKLQLLFALGGVVVAVAAFIIAFAHVN